jgi:tRNA threonylcarbamoyl adenosine modification protein YeaZ
MSDRLVLALDGSTAICSTALLRAHKDADGEGSYWTVAARRMERDGRAQAKVLLRLVDEMLEETGRTPRDLDAVVVGTGPGTFTGVRITVATARALSLALSVPVLGVSTLGALAAAAAAISDRCRLLVPVVDARRGQLFYGLYRPAGAGPPSGTTRWVRSTEFEVCDRGALGGVVTAAANDRSGPDGCPLSDSRFGLDGRQGLDPLAGTALVVGEGALAADLPAGAVFRSTDVGAEWLLVGQERLDEPGSLPQGARLTPWLVEVFGRDRGMAAPDPAVGDPGTPESVTPLYIRTPDADIHITKMRDPWADGSAGR